MSTRWKKSNKGGGVLKRKLVARNQAVATELAKRLNETEAAVVPNAQAPVEVQDPNETDINPQTLATAETSTGARGAGFDESIFPVPSSIRH